MNTLVFNANFRIVGDSGGSIQRVDMLHAFSGLNTNKDSSSDYKNSTYSAFRGLEPNLGSEMDPFEEIKTAELTAPRRT
jgi:hypothetical protein